MTGSPKVARWSEQTKESSPLAQCFALAPVRDPGVEVGQRLASHQRAHDRACRLGPFRRRASEISGLRLGDVHTGVTRPFLTIGARSSTPVGQ